MCYQGTHPPPAADLVAELETRLPSFQSVSMKSFRLISYLPCIPTFLVPSDTSKDGQGIISKVLNTGFSYKYPGNIYWSFDLAHS